MKVKLMAMAALAACSAAAMPTNDEIEKANADVMAAFGKQLMAWQGGSISDSDLSALMLMNAGKYKNMWGQPLWKGVFSGILDEMAKGDWRGPGFAIPPRK